MSKIVKLEVHNFRGIRKLILDFNPKENVVCLIGRGDSGKTSILEAISSVLSSSWNLLFNDTDFYNCDITKPIEIKASIIDFPDKLLDIEKFGLHVRLFDVDNHTIIDDVNQQNEKLLPLLTIKLTIDQSLEPKWTVTNLRSQDEKQISSSERAMLNCCLISDFIDRHFTWNKGNPLYALLKTIGTKSEEDGNIILESLRKAKEEIDKHSFDELQEVTGLITYQAQGLGLNISDTRTTLDFKEIAIKEGKISLHENLVPFRLKGKGTKRLASLAIQLAIIKEGGIMLVDEIEQGLEPDRIKNLISTIKDNQEGQVFITTHSREVIVELGNEPLYLIIRDKTGDKMESRKLDIGDLTPVVRSCPEAFFAKKVIVCEGATEVGICRALDQHRKTIGKVQMSFQDCAYIDGTGNSLVNRASNINEVRIKTALLCDSDDSSVNFKKNELKEKGISIFDCEDGFCMEKQVFKDLPWAAIQELISYALRVIRRNDKLALEESIRSKYPKDYKFNENWLSIDTVELRKALAETSIITQKEWFKRIDHGQFLGLVIFKYFDQIEDNKHLKKTLSSLLNWIDNT